MLPFLVSTRITWPRPSIVVTVLGTVTVLGEADLVTVGDAALSSYCVLMSTLVEPCGGNVTTVGRFIESYWYPVTCPFSSVLLSNNPVSKSQVALVVNCNTPVPRTTESGYAYCLARLKLNTFWLQQSSSAVRTLPVELLSILQSGNDQAGAFAALILSVPPMFAIGLLTVGAKRTGASL